MKFTKRDISKALSTITVPGEGENMVDSKAIQNIIVFGDEVIIDVTISNPTLQARKRTEIIIIKTIHDQVYKKAKVKVNVKVQKSANNSSSIIKGKPITEFRISLLLLQEREG